jgi:hypothetical protein
MAPCTRALLPALLLAVAVPAFAGVPAPPPNSTVPNACVACPLGDIPFSVIIRDLANNPIVNSMVVIDFSSCPGAFICTTPHPDPYIYDPVSRTIRMTTNATGQATFPLRVGGTCGPGSVRVFADGVMMSSYALASPDQTGNGVVFCYAIDTDCDVFNAKLGSTDPTADLDGDGDVDGDDNAIFNQHISQSCDGYVDPARKSSWGRVKSIYR